MKNFLSMPRSLKLSPPQSSSVGSPFPTFQQSPQKLPTYTTTVNRPVQK